MKLNLPKLSLQQKLNEFDTWITSTLGEIKDTEKFQTELNLIVNALEILGLRTGNFNDFDNATPNKITDAIIYNINGKSDQEQNSIVLGLLSLLFMVTGKSDNNCKCQFPVYLKNVHKTITIPKLVNRNGVKALSSIVLPRILDDTLVARITVSLKIFPIEQYNFLSSYINFLLNEPVYIKSLWAFGKTYFQLRNDNAHLAFLLPLVVYRIRGSVSASGGHNPENILRDTMKEWGLIPNIDFNTRDIVIGKQVDIVKAKTRAYDFVLPYNVDQWVPQLFIQTQFYAGDSGSVSHKNVDQIRTSRIHVKSQIENPIFLEYVDGAGYYGSLNGDLKKILEMSDTEDFFQIKTSPVKLRYYLQKIGFIVPIELFHAILHGYSSINACKGLMVKQGYTKKEIDRALKVSFYNGFLVMIGKRIQIAENYIETARRYLLLDLIVNSSIEKTLQDSGCMLIPGHGDNIGINHAELSDLLSKSEEYKNLWSDPGSILKDIQYLIDKGYILNR